MNRIGAYPLISSLSSTNIGFDHQQLDLYITIENANATSIDAMSENILYIVDIFYINNYVNFY
jgi:hypothetical protein